MEFFENKALSEAMLRGLSLHELRLLRNEVYARHGRTFKATWLQQYFDSAAVVSVQRELQRRRTVRLRQAECRTDRRLRKQDPPRLSSKPVIRRSLLEGLFLEDASQMRQEIYARHGKVFKEPYLQKYFASFDWYKVNPSFTDASLTPIERQNIATIQAYEKKAVSATSIIEG